MPAQYFRQSLFTFFDFDTHLALFALIVVVVVLILAVIKSIVDCIFCRNKKKQEETTKVKKE
jgi:hypothetical protein